MSLQHAMNSAFGFSSIPGQVGKGRDNIEVSEDEEFDKEEEEDEEGQDTLGDLGGVDSMQSMRQRISAGENSGTSTPAMDGRGAVDGTENGGSDWDNDKDHYVEDSEDADEEDSEAQGDCCSRACCDTTRRLFMIVIVLTIIILLIVYLLPAVIFFAFAVAVILSNEIKWNYPKMSVCGGCSCCCCKSAAE